MPKYTVDEFANLVKDRYREYTNVDNAVLVQAMIEKYPQYRDQIDLEVITEPTEEKKKEKKQEWEPKYTADFYESLPLMDKERANYETWKQKQEQVDTTKPTAIAPPIQVPEVNAFEEITELKEKSDLEKEAEQQILKINSELPPETATEFLENTNAVRDDIIKNNPQIIEAKEKIASDLQREFNKSLEALKLKYGIDPKAISLELSKKYDFNDAKQVVKAEEEFKKIYEEKINSADFKLAVENLQKEFDTYGNNAYNKLAQSPLFKSVFDETKAAIDLISEPLFVDFKRNQVKNLSLLDIEKDEDAFLGFKLTSDFGEGGFTSAAFSVADYLKGLGKGTIFEAEVCQIIIIENDLH